MALHGLVLLLCALYGSVFLFGKLTLEYAPPFFITASRMILAGALLLFYQYCFNRKQLTLKKEHLAPILIIGLMGVYLTNVLEFWGLQFMEAGRACFLYSFAPIATAFLSYFWFSEKISIAKWLGLIIGVIGFIPLLMGPLSMDDDSGNLFFISYAELAILGAGIATSVGWMAMRETVKNRQYSAVMANATSMIFGGVLSLVHSLIVEPWNPTPIADFWPFILWFSCLTLVSNLICYNLHSVLLRSFTATYISFAGLTQPFFAAFFGWFFMDDILNPYFWISVVVVTFGLFIYYQDALKEKGTALTPVGSTPPKIH